MREQATEISEIADACLTWLAADVTELERFMSLAGYSPQSLRDAVGTVGLEHGLVDYFARNEPLLLAMCANANMPVERVMRAWHRLNPQS
ncbi:DUF3572 family protein [Pelagibacterium xiamenense]|uniref:DUF3572 family protein n=1 Tax=Pelagibacterium xiamenense TaxID=2901140 RepID=UPI001E63895C|nr:DUF3572 family protein [Pelagibacterium xiamenense]MCD7061176.1 DUF3572 domain-containing protein [Pelagibacterium xiamenense]